MKIKRTTTKPPEGNEQKATGSSYPYYSTQRCLDVASAVAELGGSRSEVPKSVLAHSLRVDEGSGTFAQLIASAKCAGLIEGRGTYTLTELAKEYFYPTDDSQKRRALLRIVKSPEVFNRLIDRFDGSKVPSPEILANILHREFGVSESWRPRVASLFLSSLREADVLDGNGFVRYAAKLHTLRNGVRGAAEGASAEQGEDVLGSGTDETTPPMPRPDAETIQKLLEKVNRQLDGLAPFPDNRRSVTDDAEDDLDAWTFRHGDGVVKVQTSRHLSMPLWRKLNQYIQVLKPSSDSVTREADLVDPTVEEP